MGKASEAPTKTSIALGKETVPPYVKRAGPINFHGGDVVKIVRRWKGVHLLTIEGMVLRVYTNTFIMRIDPAQIDRDTDDDFVELATPYWAVHDWEVITAAPAEASL